MGEFLFDPRVFIQPPYITCPQCQAEDAFGVLMIGWGYTRRCRECWHTMRFDLPEIRKTVIYLDQLAISEMMKALNPAARAHGRVDAFWLELFERLDVLSKLQLIVCPDSDTHRDESAVAPNPGALKRMYELLSHGISFDDHVQVRDQQLIEYLKAWLEGEADRPLELDVERVTHGAIHAWQERFYITFGGLEPEDRVDELRAARERGHDGLEQLFERWQGERELSFDDFRRRELFGFGELLLEQHIRAVDTQARALAAGELTLEHLMPSSASILFEGIHHVMRESGVAEEELWTKTREFLADESLANVPYLNIASHLFAYGADWATPFTIVFARELGLQESQ